MKVSVHFQPENRGAVIDKIKTVLTGLSQTWQFRRTQPYDYIIHLQEISLSRQAAWWKYDRDRAALSRELSMANETLQAADRAKTRYELVKAGAPVTERERDLLELDASIYDAPEAIYKMVLEYEAYARAVLMLDVLTSARVRAIDESYNELMKERDLCVEARKGWFFRLLRRLKLAS